MKPWIFGCVLSLAFVCGYPSIAQAQDVSALKAELARYGLDREKGEVPREVGERLLKDLGAASPVAAANLKAAVAYHLQAEEAARFARAQRFVLAAYGIMWLLPLGFAVAIWLRHKRLLAQLAQLEAKLS